MKLILDLKLAVTTENFISDQFQKNGTEKNILFVNPQLSEKHLHKMLLPYFKLPTLKENGVSKIATAITSLSEYNEESQLFGENEWLITDEMINWGKNEGIPLYIVFPFTTQPLVSEVYKRIRDTNPIAHIVYSVDFNYYAISENHPYKYIFNEPSVIDAVEDNMYFSDLILVSNTVLREAIVGKINTLTADKYANDETNLRDVRTMHYYDDMKIVMGNVEYDIQEALFSRDLPQPIEPKNELIEKTIEAAEAVRKDVIQKKKAVVKKKPANGSTYKGTLKNKLKKQIKKVKPTPSKNAKPTKRKRTSKK